MKTDSAEPLFPSAYTKRTQGENYSISGEICFAGTCPFAAMKRFCSGFLDKTLSRMYHIATVTENHPKAGRITYKARNSAQ